MFLKLLALTKKKALMIKINIIFNHKPWQRYLKSPSNFIEKGIEDLNKKFKKYKKKNIFCTLLLSENSEIKKLNKKFRKKNKTTDILSFPNQNKKELKTLTKSNLEIYLGDIIINFKKLNNSSKILFKRQFDMLWVHGLVHLFGHDHKKDSDYKRMAAIEMKFLQKLN